MKHQTKNQTCSFERLNRKYEEVDWAPIFWFYIMGSVLFSICMIMIRHASRTQYWFERVWALAPMAPESRPAHTRAWRPRRRRASRWTERSLRPRGGWLGVGEISANFRRLVLDRIEAKFWKEILVGKLLTRSTRFTRFCTAQHFCSAVHLLSKISAKCRQTFSHFKCHSFKRL